MLEKQKIRFAELKNDQVFQNDKRRASKILKRFLFAVFRYVIIIGVAYVILNPLIGIIAGSFFSDRDAYNSMVYVIPTQPTLEKYELVWKTFPYPSTLLYSLGNDILLMIVQVFVCSMVGYGFARFDFPGKKILFACVVIMIVIPTHAIMLPLFLTVVKDMGMYDSVVPFYLMTILGCGIRSGLYIYIFNQFFRGLPKEIEEAAFVDGAGSFYTYFRIMLVNALPAVITVSVFSMVWQYNDKFYTMLFGIQKMISMRVGSIGPEIANFSTGIEAITPNVEKLYTYAAVMLTLLPLIIIYCILQKYFVEGVERSGIVG